MTKEYKVHTGHEFDLEVKINLLAEEGWEVYYIDRIPDRARQMFVVLERRKRVFPAFPPGVRSVSIGSVPTHVES